MKQSLFQASGIKVGDCLTRVGKTDIRWDSHEQAACLIHMLEDIVRVQVITPLGKNISKVWKMQQGIDLDDFLFQKQKSKPPIFSFKSLGVPKIFSQVMKTQSVIENSSEEEESVISVSEFLRSSTDCLSETSDYLSCSSDCRPSSCEE